MHFVLRIVRNWPLLLGAFMSSFAGIFLVFESYEVLTDKDILFSFPIFFAISAAVGLFYFLVDGIIVSGFLLGKIELFQKTFGSKVVVEFGDLFKQKGCKAIGVNDFFDNQVDDVLISSASLHGHVLNTYWQGNADDWYEKIRADLAGLDPIEEERQSGKVHRYPIGATAHAKSGSEKFLFVSLGCTSTADNLTVANAENLICAVRGLLRKARVVCSNQTLSIPLMGSGLARVGISNSVILDIIICGIFEELKQAKITNEIKIVLPNNLEGQIDLIPIKKKWH